MATIQKYAIGSTVTLMTTELNSLASSSGLTAGAISSVGGTSGVFNNTAGGGGLDGYAFGLFQLDHGTPAGTFTANTSFNVYLLATIDGGTKYESGGSALIPVRRPDALLQFFALSTAQVLQVIAPLKPGNWKVVVSQNGGQTLAASGNILTVSPVTWQGV